jgi:hypothetical protein
MSDHPLSKAPVVSPQRLLEDLKDLAKQNPMATAASAFGVVLLIDLLPTRLVTSAVAIAGVALLRPVLFSLGVIKAVELCCAKTKTLEIKP